MKSIREHFGYIKGQYTQGHHLFPCSNCGGYAKMCQKEGFDVFYVKCPKCGNAGPMRFNPHGAEIEWNKEYLHL